MRYRRSSFVLLCGSALFAACAHMAPPGRTSAVPEGVRLVVAEQECFWDQSRTNVMIDLVVENGAAEAVAVHGENMRLTVANGSRVAKGPPNPTGTAIVVPAGTSTVVRLYFSSRADACCGGRATLEAPGSVTLDSRPLTFQPIDFTPECTS